MAGDQLLAEALACDGAALEGLDHVEQVERHMLQSSRSPGGAAVVHAVAAERKDHGLGSPAGPLRDRGTGCAHQLPLTMAGMALASGPTIILYVAFQRFYVQGPLAGSVK